MIDANNILWVDKYKPHSVDDFVWVNQTQRQQVEKWIESKSPPHTLLSGEAGVGKSSLANLLIELCDINPYDTLIINASRENSVDTVREKIIGHVETAPLGHLKVVLLDEADSLSIQAQKALRSDIETYQATCRFILTCNYPEKIIPALKSRCYEMYINKTDQVEYTTRAAKVLLAEGVEFDIETLDLYVSTCYPDLRKCLHALQINSSTGKLLVPDETTESEDSQLIQITHLFKSGKVFEGRQALLAFLAKYPTKIENIYRWMYSNLKLWGNNTDQLDSAILIIRDGLAQLPLVGIAEISLSATLIELSRNMQD